MDKKLTAVSLFSGCGGFDWGVKQAGVKIIWANDIDPNAASAYKRLFPSVDFHFGDIRDHMAFPEADILIGCYPCTGFSEAARRRWRDSRERNLRAIGINFLFKEFLRALSQVRPKYVFVENVEGMATAENGWFFQEQLQGFEKKGYVVKSKLLDASAFGVPQSRRRLFFVGARKDVCSFDYEFPNPTRGPGKRWPFAVLKDAIGNPNIWPEWPEGEFFDYKFHGHYLTRNRKRMWDELSYSIVAHCHHVPLHPMGMPMKFIKKDTWALQGKMNRRLSWRECAALQGLPRKAVPSGTLSAKYRVIGNAVPPPLARALIKPIVSFEAAN